MSAQPITYVTMASSDPSKWCGTSFTIGLTPGGGGGCQSCGSYFTDCWLLDASLNILKNRDGGAYSQWAAFDESMCGTTTAINGDNWHFECTY